jgi:glycosyltransferase involved in cell wall biosynthesis
MMTSLAEIGRGLEDTRPIPYLAAIIPVYDEAGRVGQVLSVLREVACLNEIIVVDDGSTDSTLEEVLLCAALDSRIQVLSHDENQGKGQAVYKGKSATRATYLLLLDGDLIGLKAQHVHDLIRPVMGGSADMTLGVFRGGRFKTDLSHWATPWLTGQRCLRTNLFRYVSSDAAAGYGIETALTVACRRQGWRCQTVTLRGVYHPPSEFHRGVWTGVKVRAKMYAQIVRAFYLASSWKQFIRRLRLHMQFGKLH